MSLAFERVIAEQQKEIDRLRNSKNINIKDWKRERARVEKLVDAAFGVLNFPDRLVGHQDLRLAIVDMGYCLQCQCEDCECAGDGY